MRPVMARILAFIMVTAAAAVPIGAAIAVAIAVALSGAIFGAIGTAQAAAVVSSKASGLEIELNKGRLVRLERPAATVFIANPEIADIQVKSPTLIYVFAKKVGATTLFAVDARERVMTNLPVTVIHDITRLNAVLHDLVADADIRAESTEGAVVLVGTAKSAVEAEDARRVAARFIGEGEEIINRITLTGPNQINLRVRVAEVSRDVVKQLGINWDVAALAGNFIFGIATGNPVVAGPLLGANTLITRAAGTNSIFLKRSTGSLDINTIIEALDKEGMITVLAEPNLTALSGETASFLAGGEFPVPVPQSLDRITIQFKKFGVSLSFTPTLLANGRISLRVRPEVSQLSNTGALQLQGFSIPALTTRRAETTVELASGQSFAIAGLLQNDVTHDLSKLPGLGDLPVLGPLFRSDSFKRNESELVIIVTPYIVRPVSGKKLASPTDGLVQPNDIERIILGQTYRPQLKGKAPAPVGQSGQRLTGPVGFVLE